MLVSYLHYLDTNQSKGRSQNQNSNARLADKLLSVARMARIKAATSS